MPTQRTKKETLKQYLINVFIATDQWINAVLFGGDPDETISSRLGRNYDGTWIEKFVNWLFKWQKDDHCSNSIEYDEGKDAIIALNKNNKNLG